VAIEDRFRCNCLLSPVVVGQCAKTNPNAASSCIQKLLVVDAMIALCCV